MIVNFNTSLGTYDHLNPTLHTFELSDTIGTVEIIKCRMMTYINSQYKAKNKTQFIITLSSARIQKSHLT